MRESAEQPAEGFPRAPEHDEEHVRLFALFHDSCRHDEYADPDHGPRGAQLAIDFHQAGHFQLDDPRMELLVTACRIHNGGMPQSEPTLAVCLDADRLDLGRVGIIPDPLRLSTATAQEMARLGTSFQDCVFAPHRRMPLPPSGFIASVFK